MKNLFLLSLALFPLFANAQVDSVMTQENQPITYDQMIKSARGLKIGGGIAAGVGLVFWAIGGSKATEYTGNLLLSPLTGQVPEENNTGGAEIIIGTVLFVGGLTTFIVGLVKSSKAQKMYASGQFSLKPYAPPAFVAPKASISQVGFTYKMPLHFGR